jgi:hypothetical protein
VLDESPLALVTSPTFSHEPEATLHW